MVSTAAVILFYKSGMLTGCGGTNTLFVPPQPMSVPDLKNRITVAVETITPDLLSRVSVACTVPRFNPLWLLPLGLREGQSVCATTTREHTWFEEQNYRSCGDPHTWLAEQSMAGIGLSPQCVPCDEGCIHQTFVGMGHKLVELLFHFY